MGETESTRKDVSIPANVVPLNEKNSDDAGSVRAAATSPNVVGVNPSSGVKRRNDPAYVGVAPTSLGKSTKIDEKLPFANRMTVSVAAAIEPTPGSSDAERLPTERLAVTLPEFGGLSGSINGVTFVASMPGREIVTVPTVPKAGKVAEGGNGTSGSERLLSVTTTSKFTVTAEAAIVELIVSRKAESKAFACNILNPIIMQKLKLFVKLKVMRAISFAQGFFLSHNLPWLAFQGPVKLLLFRLKRRHPRAGQFVGAFILGMAGVALYPCPLNVVGVLRRIKSFP